MGWLWCLLVPKRDGDHLLVCQRIRALDQGHLSFPSLAAGTGTFSPATVQRAGFRGEKHSWFFTKVATAVDGGADNHQPA